MPLIYLIAGEASGDVLGSRLMRAIAAQRPDVRFAGIGGDEMARSGLTSLFPIRELALMGLVEVLPKLRRLRARLAQTTADIAARRPDVVVTIDSPGFTLRVLRADRAAGAFRACTTSRRRSGRGGRAACATIPDYGTGCSACCRSSRTSSPGTTCPLPSSAIRCWRAGPTRAMPPGSAPATTCPRTRESSP